MPPDDLSKLRIDKTTMSPSAGGRRKKRIFYAAGGLLLLLLIVYLAATGRFSPAVTVQAATVGQVYPSQTFTLLNASGYVVAQRKAALSSKITGRIISLNVEEGSRVKKGEIIARLEAEDVLALREQAAATLSQAKAELQDASLAFARNAELIKSSYITRAEYDASEARYLRARAAVEAAAANLKGANVSVDYTLLRAPFDAVVLTKNADIGDIVTPLGATANVQSAVVTVADMGSLRVEVDVSESNIGQVKLGQPCEVQLDALPDTRFRGVVHMIVPTADRSKATVMVKIGFVDKDPRVLPEMSAKAAFLSREPKPDEMKPFTAVAVSSVVAKNGEKRVFRIDGDRAHEVAIRAGRQMGDYVEVLSGVAIGERIVARPPEGLRDGGRIAIEEK